MSVLQGANAADIQFHYDLDRQFYELWLDKTLTYSCAMFRDGDDLASAQIRKLDFHLDQAEVTNCSRVLDIGSGWGSLMKRGINRFPHAAFTGLTLNLDQKNYVDAQALPNVSQYFVDWRDFHDVKVFDGAICIGALEHFASPGLDSAQRIAIYRDFFKKVSSLLKPDGALSLQYTSFDRMQERDFAQFISERIWPNSMLPRSFEPIAAADRILRLEHLQNDGYDYARTCRIWAQRLGAKKDAANDLISPHRVLDYLRYLRMSATAFESDCFKLVRATFRTYRGD